MLRRKQLCLLVAREGERAGGGLNGAPIYHSGAAERNEVWGVGMLCVVGLEVVFGRVF